LEIIIDLPFGFPINNIISREHGRFGQIGYMWKAEGEANSEEEANSDDSADYFNTKN